MTQTIKCHFCKDAAVCLTITREELPLCKNHKRDFDGLTWMMKDQRMVLDDFEFVAPETISVGDKIFDNWTERVLPVQKIWKEREDDENWSMTVEGGFLVSQVRPGKIIARSSTRNEDSLSSDGVRRSTRTRQPPQRYGY